GREAGDLLARAPRERRAEALLELVDEPAARRREGAELGGVQRGEQLAHEVAGEGEEAAEHAGPRAGAQVVESGELDLGQEEGGPAREAAEGALGERDPPGGVDGELLVGRGDDRLDPGRDGRSARRLLGGERRAEGGEGGEAVV